MALIRATAPHITALVDLLLRPRTIYTFRNMIINVHW